ncbi:MAG: hypothetical protein HY317_04890 [Acidobacteria bacterium]|nr:hypothetical protein [Acidobacteriota bacterium]
MLGAAAFVGCVIALRLEAYEWTPAISYLPRALWSWYYRGACLCTAAILFLVTDVLFADRDDGGPPSPGV